MSVIKVEDLTFSYPASYDNIFEHVSFTIDSDWKLGFIGRNGRGKTTFLNLLTGKYQYRGKIISSVKFDYFPYPVEDETRQTADILAEICPDAQKWQFLREFSALDMREDVLYRPFETLSHGEKTKALLAALFLNEGHFLLIDEPTNHLDSAARERLAKYLNGKKSFILVSHDRYFLDGCVDHILSLNRANIEVQSGNFTTFMQNFERQQAFEQSRNDRLETDIKRLKETARRTARWADIVEASKIGAGDKGYVGHKSAKMMKRAKVTEARQQKEIEQKSALLKNREVDSPLKLSPLTYHAGRLAYFSGVAPVYNGREVCAPVTFEIKRGDRIAIDGKNGSGKSSLLKLLCGQNIGHLGEVRTGSQLVISCVPQDASHISGSLKDLAAERDIDESVFKTTLHKMGFNKDQFEKDMADFSAGQKKKALLAASLCERAHLYVWDEPLNYIDIYSRIQLENLILQFAPTLIFVEHDRAFRENAATKIIDI